MRKAIVYASVHHGNTEKLVKGIAEGTGTLKVHLMDAMSNMNAEWMERSSQIESKC